MIHSLTNPYHTLQIYWDEWKNTVIRCLWQGDCFCISVSFLLMEDHRSRIPVRAYVSVVIFLERKVMSNKSLETIGYYNILEKLRECTSTEKAGERILEMQPILSETDLRKQLRDTTQARAMLEL